MNNNLFKLPAPQNSFAMMDEFEEQRRKQITRTRSAMNYIMGVLFIIIGIYLLTYARWGVNIFSQEPSATDYVFGSLFVLYGIWRLYRGYKKNYFI